jgi:hypothetical protein
MLSGLAAAPTPAFAAAADVSLITPDECNGGSSNPTFNANNRRLVVTPGGREIGVYDPHGSGVQLIWRDPGGSWQQRSIFVNAADEVSNDRPASIALDGLGHAWVVWSGYNFSKISPLKLRRLTNLGAPSGPTVGPVVTVQPAGRGNAFADLAFQGGTGYIVWLERTGDTTYALKTTQFVDLASDTPGFTNTAVLNPSAAVADYGTLVPMPDGMRVVARAGSKLKVFVNTGGAVWSKGTAGVSVPGKPKASAVAFGSDILATYQANPTSDNIVKVVRFSSTGSGITGTWTFGAAGTTGSTEYVQPVLAGNGVTAFLVMVRKGAESAVVSSRFDGSTWGSIVVEMPTSGVVKGGDYAYPNAERDLTGGALRFLVDGMRCASSAQRQAVLAYRRAL